MSEPTGNATGPAFGDDPGTDTFTVYVDGVKVDPTTLPGYVATGPNVSIAEAAKTGDYTIRDDGLIEYVRPMTAQTPGQQTAQHSPPPGLCVVVCDKTGVVVRIEGSPVPDGVAMNEPLPAPAAPAAPAAAPVSKVAAPAAPAAPAAVDTAPDAPVAPLQPIDNNTPAVRLHPAGTQGSGAMVLEVIRVGEEGIREVEHAFVWTYEEAAKVFERVFRPHHKANPAPPPAP